MNRLPAVAFALLLALAGCVGAGVPGAGGPSGETGDGTVREATVVRVVDGDTVEVAFGNGTRETVRLLGVDTPEVSAENAPGEFEGVPDTAAGAECLRRWGERASSFAAERLADREVTVRTDPVADRRGSYGRLLAYVAVEGNRSFNRALLDAGYARLYDSEFSRLDAYREAEAGARESGTGLWGDCRSPGRNASGPLAVAGFQPDAPGNDNENLRAEYVVLENTNGELDLAGWTLSDSAGHTYTFPETRLPGNATVRVVTGSGEDAEGVRYWGRSGAVWNNGGDTLTVRRPNGSVVLRYRY
jgi:micrococcal nuclease